MARPRKEVDTSTYAGRFAVRLKTFREKRGMSVDELSKTSGVPITTVKNWESATRKPVIDEKFLQFANALGIHAGTLLPKK